MNLIDQLPDNEPLSLEGEASLQKRGRLNELVMANIREAVIYAKTCNGKIHDDELISICYETLMKTARTFHPKHRVRFFAYSKARLRGALLRHFSTSALVRNAECVSLDVSMAGANANAGYDGDASEINSGRTHEAETSEEPQFELIDFRERFAEISGAIARHCNDRERSILMLVFNYGFTFERAGKCHGLCRAAAQAIASDAIDRVKKILGK